MGEAGREAVPEGGGARELPHHGEDPRCGRCCTCAWRGDKAATGDNCSPREMYMPAQEGGEVVSEALLQMPAAVCCHQYKTVTSCCPLYRTINSSHYAQDLW